MDLKTFPPRHFLWIAPLSLALGAGMASLQAGNWFIGWAAFSFLFLLACFLLMLSARWAASTAGLDTADNRRLLDPPLSAKNALAWMVALAFILRLAVGVTLYLALPVNGHDTADDRAGFVFTDAHRRDNQAWELASSTHPIIDAFREKYAY